MKTRSGQIIVPTMAGGPTSRWNDLGNLTSAQTEPLVADRNWTDIMALSDAKTIKFDIPELAENVDFRFEGTADGDIDQIHIMVAADQYLDDGVTEDSFAIGAHLTLTTGKQVGSESNFFVDTIVETAPGVLDGTIYNTAGDSIAAYGVNLRGYRKGVIIAVVLGTTTLHAHARW